MSASEGPMELPMLGRRVLVTGATSGIGQVAAQALAMLGAELVIVGRDVLRAEATADLLRRSGAGAKVDVLLADLSSQAQVRRLAGDFLRRYDRLDVLLNNAGALFPERRVSADGVELTLALNHLAPFLLTHLLRPALERAPSARVVTVASEAGRWGRLHFDDVQLERGWSPWKAYAQSKLANILFTRELARRLEGTRVTATCLHPGAVATRFGGQGRGLMGLAFRVGRPLLRTPERGAETAVWLASSPAVQGITGAYFQDLEPRRPPRRARDDAAARWLWEESERLTGLAPRGPAQAQG